ncbi:MAG TPA: hypothetical protein VF734_12585 [Pseudonocardiaceae bacterium]
MSSKSRRCSCGWPKQRAPELGKLAAELDHVATGLTGTLNELRDYARGIHLAILTQGGLGLLHRGKTSFGMLKPMRRVCRVRPVLLPRSAFAGFRFPREVIVLAVRWYRRYGLS